MLLGFACVVSLGGLVITSAAMFSLSDRTASVQPWAVLNAGLASLGLLFCGLTIAAAHHNVIQPIHEIITFIKEFRRNNNLAHRLSREGMVGIGELREEINGLIDEIQVSNQKLIAAQEQLKFEATHDALTGTWNCAAALELLDREISRSERDRTTVAVLMLDLDDFKGVNDKFGHAAGDLVLRAITASIVRILRTSDVLARYGGEEFLVIAPDCSPAEAVRLAERILLRLRSTAIPLGEQEARVTASIGISAGSFPFTSEELIALADRALYQAKAHGRDRAECEDASPARVKATLYSMPRRNV
jgi:diguanylate cyclase (GGDEF)-like protein